MCCCFFKQKTAYEMRISDWSSDVCSSDLFQTLRFLPMKKAALIVLLSAATALAGPIACSSGKDKSSATYTLGTELGINKAAMDTGRSEEHTSELQSLMRISYALFCLQKKNSTKSRLYTTTPLHTSS